MADSVKEKILQNLETALKAITVTGGYNNDVGFVERSRVSPIRLPKYPAALIQPGEDDVSEEKMGDLVNRLFSFTAMVWVKPSKDLSKSLESFLGDTQKAIMTDPTRGGNAHDTIEGPTSYLHLEGTENEAGAEIAFEIRYRTKRADPFTAA